MKVGFLGTGTIAAAMVQGIANDGHQIWISERNQVISSQLSQQFSVVTVADNQTVVDQADTVIICLLVDTARQILPTLNFRPEQQILSVMVPMALAEVSGLVAPAFAEAIFIPFPFIRQGNSPLLVYPQSNTLETLFGQRNELVILSNETDLQSYLSAQAILLPTIKLLHEATGWLQERVGEDVSAETFIRLLIGGYLTADPLDQPNVLAQALIDLGTEGGLNAQLRDHFAEHGVYEALREGLDAIEKRLS